MALGNLLGGIGSALSGLGALGSVFGGKKSKPSGTQIGLQAHYDQLGYERQKEFAQNQVQWRADDARKAGLHPLYALGGAASSYQPTAFIPGQSESGSHWSDAARGVGRAMTNFQAAKQARETHVLDKEERLARIGELRARQGLINAQAYDIALDQAQRQGQAATWVEAGAAGIDPSTAAPTGVSEGGSPYRVPSSRAGKMPFDVDPSKLSDEYIYYRRPDGTVGKTLNPDVVGEEILSAPFMRYLYEELLGKDRREYEDQWVRRGRPAPRPQYRGHPWGDSRR